jgi:cytochrome c oxidase subunit 2
MIMFNPKLFLKVRTLYSLMFFNSWFCLFELSLDFQESASTTFDGLYLFNCNLLFLISNIVIFTWWLIFVICLNFFDQSSSESMNFTHSNNIEIIWTTIPALLLLSLASPSFSLLYSLDEIITPELTLKILGHQWYWTYEISDYKFCSCVKKEFKFSCYLLTNEFLKNSENLGLFRLLETNKRTILPTNTHIRLLITAVDVLHSWTIPSFGIKVDACPGRLNQANLFIKRIGVFFGQCSEICGVNHGFMPIVVVACPSESFYSMVLDK